jgi:hypothetical protein
MLVCAFVKLIIKHVGFVMSVCPPSVLNEQIFSLSNGISLHE